MLERKKYTWGCETATSDVTIKACIFQNGYHCLVALLHPSIANTLTQCCSDDLGKVMYHQYKIKRFLKQLTDL